MNSITRSHPNNRILDVVNLDRGKRHYWGDINGDYGFV
jgi:hypothetical protein